MDLKKAQMAADPKAIAEEKAAEREKQQKAKLAKEALKPQLKSFIQSLQEPGEITPDETSIFQKSGEGRYAIEHKYLAIAYCKANTIQEPDGTTHPDWSAVSTLTGIEILTLRRWWEDAPTITKKVESVLVESSNFILLRMITLLMKVVDSLSDTDLADMTVKNKIDVINTLIPKIEAMTRIQVVKKPEEEKEERGVAMIMPESLNNELNPDGQL
jgi:hypothetical protein